MAAWLVLLLQGLIATQIYDWDAFKAMNYADQLSLVTGDIGGMSLSEIDGWWQEQKSSENGLLAAALVVVLRRGCEWCLRKRQIIDYKRALRLSCSVLKREAMNSILTKLRDLKWPTQFSTFVHRGDTSFVLKAADAPEESIELTDQVILDTPLFQVVSAYSMMHFLSKIQVEERADYLLEMSIADLPLSSLLGVIKQKNSVEQVVRAFIFERESWLKSTGSYLSPFVRAALLQSICKGSDDPQAKFLYQVAYAGECLFELEYLRNGCPRKRNERLNSIKSTLIDASRALHHYYHDLDTVAQKYLQPTVETSESTNGEGPKLWSSIFLPLLKYYSYFDGSPEHFTAMIM